MTDDITSAVAHSPPHDHPDVKYYIPCGWMDGWIRTLVHELSEKVKVQDICWDENPSYDAFSSYYLH